MKHEEYIRMIAEVESKDWESIRERVTPELLRALHGGIGAATESGELLDQIKKRIFYGAELDKVNVLEEVGDILWYCGLIMMSMGKTLEDAMEKNAEKLRSRYPGKFTKEDALNRNLDRERRILEGEKDEDGKP